MDGGVRFADGHPLLGPSKTWRGLLGAIAATSAVASLLGLGWWTGMLAASTAHAGDLFSSFTKRRWGIPSSGRAPLLDQLPEALLPAFALSGILGLGVLDIVVVAIAFMAVEIFLSPILYRLEIRDKPY
ncbi:MAG: CDP-archaeol synthase [Pseudomonadota bacterium]